MNSQTKNSHTDQTKSKSYTFAQREGDDFSCIKITEGEFKDVIYKYGKVQFASEETANGKMPLRFNYEVMKNPNNVDTKSENFRNKIGDILVEVMEEQLKDGKLSIINSEE